MLQELTSDMEAKLPEYVKWGIEKGTTTTTPARARVEEIVKELYERVLKKPAPQRVIIKSSPMQCHHAAMLAQVALNSDGKIVFPEDNDAEMVMKPEYCSDGRIPDFVWPYIDGQFSTGYFAQYKALQEVCGVEIKDENGSFNAYRNTMETGPIWPLFDTGICVVCLPPTVLHYNASGMHCENGPAVVYPDKLFGDFEIYALNGVSVPKEVVMTPKEEVDKAWLDTHFFREPNAEIRREILRKIGVETFIGYVDAETVDTMGDYSLLKIEIMPGVEARYLKMLNPSTGTWHVEGVADTCKTCQAALLWANNIPEDRVAEDGLDWYQQGDVLIFPAEFRTDPKSKLKPAPAVLT